jgi:hypothetical protein
MTRSACQIWEMISRRSRALRCGIFTIETLKAKQTRTNGASVHRITGQKLLNRVLVYRVLFHKSKMTQPRIAAKSITISLAFRDGINFSGYLYCLGHCAPVLFSPRSSLLSFTVCHPNYLLHLAANRPSMPFLNLPSELRLQVYAHIINSVSVPRSEKMVNFEDLILLCR